MEDVYICSAVRTPIGSFGGVLSSLSAIDCTIAVKGVLEKSNVNSQDVSEVFMGNVCSANLGQAPARQLVLNANLSPTTSATTVNKVCSSGMKAIMLGIQSIQLGINQVVIAWGMKSMSNIPFYLPTNRWGKKYGHTQIIDGLANDGLSDAFEKIPMGVYADNTAKKYKISRDEQEMNKR